MKIRFPFLTIMLIASFMYAHAYSIESEIILKSYSINQVFPDTFIVDTLPGDSTSSLTIKKSADSLDATIKYSATDSTWFDIAAQKVFLLGNGKVEYRDITLTADSIIFDWGTSEVTAIGRKDSSGKIRGKPVFSQGESDYKAEEIRYNFKTRKGKIEDIVTQEGEGFIHSENVKRMSNEVLYGAQNLYTTCDAAEPHFYIATSKIKVIPGKGIVTGPANLVVAGVRTPLVVPFGIFPLNSTRKSGIIFPEYGEREDLGFFLRHGGYYFGISDHLDLALTGDIYSKGSWLVNAATRFSKRYKFSGGFNITYANTRTYVPEFNAYSKGKQFNLKLDFRQDAKARPNSYYSGSVAFGTSGFNQLFADAQNNYLSNTYQSSISFHQNLPNTPFNFTISASHWQSTLTHVVTVQLPVLNFSMNQVYPFKRKIQIGKIKWYEKIGMSYAFDARNQVGTLDSLFFSNNTFSQLQAGAQHRIPISAPFQLFKFVTISPSVNFTETWALQTIDKTYLRDENAISIDTIQHFAAVHDYSLNLSGSTRIYGMLNFKKGKIKAIRHVFNPSIGYGYHPDYSDPKYDIYKTVQYDSLGNTQQYSIFQGGVYGGPGIGEYNGINVSLNNNLEMKVASKKDTITGTKKIKLLESLNLGGSYNFAADSLNFSPVSLTARTTLFDKVGINYSSQFDPYIADSAGRRINTYAWDAEKKLLRLTGASLGMDAHFASSKGSGGKELTQEQIDYLAFSGNRYENFNIPWTMAIGYNLYLRKANTLDGNDTTTLTQTISFNGSFNLTSKWRISGSTSYDFVNRQFPTAYIQIYRDLHCWEMSMQWIPFGIRQSYVFSIRVKASVLQDLKLKKTQGWYEY